MLLVLYQRWHVHGWERERGGNISASEWPAGWRPALGRHNAHARLQRVPRGLSAHAHQAATATVIAQGTQGTEAVPRLRTGCSAAGIWDCVLLLLLLLSSTTTTMWSIDAASNETNLFCRGTQLNPAVSDWSVSLCASVCRKTHRIRPHDIHAHTMRHTDPALHHMALQGGYSHTVHSSSLTRDRPLRVVGSRC